MPRNNNARATIAELPCERASRVIIPSIRAALVRHLVENKKISRYNVAKLLGITPASVTNYMKGERGDPELEKRILSEEKYYRIIEVMANLILSSKGLGDPKTYVRFRELVCTICSGLNEVAQRAGCNQSK